MNKVGKYVALLLIVLAATFTFSMIKPSHETSQATSFMVGGDRPVFVDSPSGYSSNDPAPLLIDLHGYMGTSVSEARFAQLDTAAKKNHMIYAAPDGLTDANGYEFWNASSACCNFFKNPVDDAAYIDSLIDEISAKVAVDPKRIYVFGHSNGHFMTYKYACTHSSRVAAIAGLAGAMDIDPRTCKAKSPVNVLHIHGSADEVVLPNGGYMGDVQYPSVKETIAQWLAIDKCTAPAVMSSPFDVVTSIDGAETTSTKYVCPDSTVELWSVAAGTHHPVLDSVFSQQVIDWLLAHPKK